MDNCCIFAVIFLQLLHYSVSLEHCKQLVKKKNYGTLLNILVNVDLEKGGTILALLIFGIVMLIFSRTLSAYE